MMQLFIRKIQKKDSDEILLWRNNSLSRKMSKSTDFILKKEHTKWFNKIISNNFFFPLICIDKLQKLKIAFIIFHIDNTKKNSIISINLNPLCRNMGFSQPCLIEAIKKLKINYAECKSVFAEIKDINKPSIKSFKKIGFKKIDSSVDGVSRYEFKMKDVY